MGVISGNGTAVRGLGGARGYGETELARGDDTVTRVDVSAVFGAGFTIGGVTYDAGDLFISTDGMVSFGKGQAGVTPPAAPFLAIFNADVDTRLDGEGAESGGIWLDVDTAQDCITITWDQVGFYRRNATLTNTFQMQLFDRGGGSFDVVYRYQDISWTSGDLQDGWGGLGGRAALIGTRAEEGGPVTLLPASGVEAAQLTLDTAIGNTGVKGLWVIPFDTASIIQGTTGADVLAGTALADTMRGLAGDDVLQCSLGADLLDGGAGIDRADYSGANGAVLINLRQPAAQVRGQAAGDTYLSIERFTGSNMADTIIGARRDDDFNGGQGLDSLAGWSGADSLAGGDQNDQLFGGSGADYLWGGAGNDLVSGGKGADILTGGSGADDFVFAGKGGRSRDWIMDYDASAGDSLEFNRPAATRDDFRVTYVSDPGAGDAGVKEAHITYLPTGKLIWVLVDAERETSIMVHSSMNSFDLL